MGDASSFVAANRFGLGARPGDLAGIAARGPREWLREQLDHADPAVDARLASLPPSTAAVQRLVAMRGVEGEEKKAMKEEVKDAFKEEQSLLLVAAATSQTPFRERLVAFWANHFTVSITRDEVAGIAGAFEREVIRANLDRTFDDLLLASTRHPAMLGYLDNYRSIGPSSAVGRKTGKGLNENLAREVLELHTLGVDGGYGQTDVEALARLLTGWSLDKDTGASAFHATRHEPGPKTLLGAVYARGGEADGLAALHDLARHPSTARHVARKLARAFVADDPPPSAVGKLESAFVTSGGDLPTVHRALVDLEEAWADPLAKLKTPWDLVVSTARMLGGATDGEAMLKSLRFLGQLPYQAPSPKGWPDVAAEWAGPEAVLSRLEWADEVGRRVPVADVPKLAKSVLGPMLHPRTERALERATGAEALALLIACPEFQRR